MIFCAISDQRDNNVLLEHIIKDIATRFTNMMGGILQSTAKSNVELYRDFDATIVNMLKNKEQKRTKGTMVKGSIWGLFTLIGTFIALIIILSGMGIHIGAADQTTILVAIILYLSFGLPYATYVGGKKAGSTHYGTRQGILFYVLLALGAGYIAPILIIFFIALAPIGMAACAAAGYYGGLKTDQKKLYPLEQ